MSEIKNTELVSIFAAGRICEEMFKQEGVIRENIPNYFYNYNRKGNLPVAVELVDGKPMVTLGDVKTLFEWLKSTKRSGGRRIDHAAAAQALLQ